MPAIRNIKIDPCLGWMIVICVLSIAFGISLGFGIAHVLNKLGGINA